MTPQSREKRDSSPWQGSDIRTHRRTTFLLTMSDLDT
jgi:hypothetical protein